MKKKHVKVVTLLITITTGIFFVYYLGWHWNGSTGVKHARSDEIKKSQPLWCENGAVDFGYVYRPASELVRHTYRIENTSLEPLKLKIAAKSCACEKIELTRDQIDSGQFTELQLAWKVSNTPGQHTYELYVQAVPQELGGIRLSGKIFVKDRFIVEPLEVVFSKVRPDETRTQELQIQSPPGYDFSPNLSFSTINDPNKVLTVSTKQKTAYKMILELSLTGRLYGGRQDHGIIISTGDKVQPEIRIPVQVHYLDPYQAQPSVVMFSKYQDKSQTKWIKIVSNIDSEVNIQRLVPDDPSLIAVDTGVNGTNEVQVGILLKNQNLQESKTGRIEVFLDGQDRPVIVRYLCLGD